MQAASRYTRPRQLSDDYVMNLQLVCARDRLSALNNEVREQKGIYRNNVKAFVYNHSGNRVDFIPSCARAPVRRLNGIQLRLLLFTSCAGSGAVMNGWKEGNSCDDYTYVPKTVRCCKSQRKRRRFFT